jgi:hypothetical protein
MSSFSNDSYDDLHFSDNNPFAGSNHYFSNGIAHGINNTEAIATAQTETETQAEIETENSQIVDTAGTGAGANSDLDSDSDSDSDDHYDDGHAPAPTRAPTPAPATPQPWIPSFDVLKDFKGTSTVFYKVCLPESDNYVLRRYNDFKSLRNYLCKFYPYLFIPPIPEKHSFSRFMKNPFNYKNDVSIIELRIRLLNYFLSRIFEPQSELQHSQIMQKFLDPLINDWGSILNSPPFTNLSSNSILLIQTRNPTKPSPYFSFLPIPPLSLLKSFKTDLNTDVFANLENSLKILYKLTSSMELRTKTIIKHFSSLRETMVEFGGFLNIFSILENQNNSIEKLGNKIDLNFLNIEILSANITRLIKEPLIIIKNSIVYMLHMLHFRKLKELQLVYFQSIILKKQTRLKSLIYSLNPQALVPLSSSSSSSFSFQSSTGQHLPPPATSSPSLSLAIQNMQSKQLKQQSQSKSRSRSQSQSSKNSPSLSEDFKKITRSEIKTLKEDLSQNLLPAYTHLQEDVKFLSSSVEREISTEFANVMKLFTQLMKDWGSVEKSGHITGCYTDYLDKCKGVWENE